MQGILEAAETTAADIERQAVEDAARMREEAALDAERTRTEAVQRAQAHVAAVAQATAVLLGRVESMDGEVGALVQSLQAGAGRLAGDLASVETEMGELYDAASGRRRGGAQRAGAKCAVVSATGACCLGAPAARRSGSPGCAGAPRRGRTTCRGAAARCSEPPPAAPPMPTSPPPRPAEPVAPPAPAVAESAPVGTGGDLDGARLVALNMALNGESREQADRYLQENFQLADRAKLLDEVYAAIEV